LTLSLAIFFSIQSHDTTLALSLSESSFGYIDCINESNNFISQMTQSEQILALALKKVKQKINWKGIISTWPFSLLPSLSKPMKLFFNQKQNKKEDTINFTRIHHASMQICTFRSQIIQVIIIIL
jgi:hypothetical protein